MDSSSSMCLQLRLSPFITLFAMPMAFRCGSLPAIGHISVRRMLTSYAEFMVVRIVLLGRKSLQL